MQQLGRVIFMNSATIGYQEFILDGNIHFIGTQGVGKTAVLRAILFFYTADSRRLGISKEQKPFAEYYFPHVNSYIVYEVMREDRTFCVWLQRRQNRLVFRFIDHAFLRDTFINEKDVLPEETVSKNYRAKGAKVEKQLSNKDFLDTIYGAKRDMRRYSLLESHTYQNIPRTISNIFLNSSLDASFIKQTIIHSLTDDPHVIDLDTNRHHLETARKDYRDVLEYGKHERKAQNIARAYDATLETEETMKKLAWQAGAALNYSLKEAKNTEYQATEKKQAIHGKKEEKRKAENNARQEIDNLNTKAGMMKENIRKANQKKKYYEQQHIDRLLAGHQKKPQYESQWDQKVQTLKNLTQEHQDIGQRFEYAIKDVENKLSRDKEHYQKEVSRAKERYYTNKEAEEQSYSAHEQKVDNEYNQQLEQVRKEIQDARLHLGDLDNQLKNMGEKPWFNDEMKGLDQKMASLQQDQAVKKEKKEGNRQETDRVRKDWDHALEKVESHYMREIQNTREQTEQIHQRIKGTEEKLKDYHHTLIQFLDREKPHWRDNIGKVIHEDLLLQTSLQPEKAGGEDFFGIKVDLDQLSPTVLSKSGLEQELKSDGEKLASLRISLRQLQDKLEDERTKVRKKYNKKVKDLQEAEKKLGHDLDQLKIRLEELRHDKERLQEKAKKKKEEEIGRSRDERTVKEREMKEKEGNENRLLHEQKEKRTNLRKEKEKKIKHLKKDRDASIKTCEQKMEQMEADAGEEKQVLDRQRKTALEGKGVDTEAIRQLEQQKKELDDKIKWINENYELIVHYKKDHKDYMARLDEFRRERRLLEEKIEKRQENLNNRLKAFERDMEKLQQELNQIESRQKHHRGEIHYMGNEFAPQDLYAQYKAYIENQDTFTEDTPRNLVHRLTNEYLKQTEAKNRLMEKAGQFAGHFSEDNILKFKVKIQTVNESMAFARALKDFLDKEKILDFQTEVNQKYAMVLQHIWKETDDLLEHEKHVELVIRKINQDFKRSNFVGVVRSIEMRTRKSSNPLVQVLKAIRDFQVENPHACGRPNLFSGKDKEQQDKDAVDLLEELHNRMDRHKERKVHLEDAFELEFRIRENENDTDWVNRLANVGSNGTDVLVKSMVYINLLNIFKKAETRKTHNSKLHCLIDEVGVLHDSNVKGLIDFASERNINLINGSPNSHNEEDYKHIYQFRKDKHTNSTRVVKLLSEYH